MQRACFGTVAVIIAGALSLVRVAAPKAQPIAPVPGPAAPVPGPADESGDGAGRASPDVDSPITVDPIDVAAPAPAPADEGALTGASHQANGAERALSDSAFVTVVRVSDHGAETSTVAEVVARSAGVHVRSLGGLDSFSSISVRGADSGHTTVFVDGVPVSRLASVGVDLSRYPLYSFAEIELYRGSVPVELGGEAMGGALHLHTPVGASPLGARLSMSAGGGSFGARHLRGSASGSMAGGAYHLGLGYAGATGDFSYFNDNGTNLTRDDDAFVRRQNNGYDHGYLVGRYRRRLGELSVEAGTRSLIKDQGIPGSASVQSQTTSLTTFSQILDAALEKQTLFGSPRLWGRGAAYTALEWQHYQDPQSEVGFGVQDRRYFTFTAGTVATLALDTARHGVRIGLSSQLDSFRTDDDTAMDSARGIRVSGALMASDELSLGAEDRLVVSPGLRLDSVRTWPSDDANIPVIDGEALAPRTEAFFSPRLSSRGRLVPGLALKGSLGRYVRMPTSIELFGDRGFVAGNPGLRAESGISGDLGLVLAPAMQLGPIDRVSLEAAAFARQSTDTIAYVATMGLTSVALNMGGAQTRGVEAAASFRVLETATLSGNYTLLATSQDSPRPSYDGKPLPNRPRHQLYARLDLARAVFGHEVHLWGDVTATSGNYLDAAALSQVPARRLLGVGTKIELGAGMRLGLEAKNLLDARIESIVLDPAPSPELTRIPRPVCDFFGYPLPGRAFYATVEWSH